MHPLDPDFAIPDIVGRQLNLVGVGKWDAQFCFDVTRVIQAMGKVDITTGGRSVTVFDTQWLDIAPIQQIVGLEVTAWRRLDDHSFSVTLTGGSFITFHTSDSPYEELIVHPEMWVF